MTDTAEVKTANMETNSALPPEETERLGGEIVAALRRCSIRKSRPISTSSG